MGSELERQIAGLKQGEHLCLIYETVAEQMAAMVPFVKEGLKRGERCAYIVDDTSTAEVAAALAAAGVDVPLERGRGALLLLTSQATYSRDGRFDPEAMIDFLRRATEEALAAGFAGLRVTGEMTWALGSEVGCARVIEYEARLNSFFPGTRALAICQYDRRRFPAAIIRDVLRTHPVVILGQQVCPNLYYESPDLLLGQVSEAERVDRMIANLQRVRIAEEALRESEERFRSAFGGAAIGMALVATDGRLLQVNRSLCEIVGYAEPELLATTFQAITHPDDLQPDLALLRQALAGERLSYQMEKRYFHKLGQVVWALLTVSLVRNAGGNPLYFVSQIQDITERKLEEEARQALYQASLAIQEPLELKERLERLLQTARDVLRLDRVNILLADPEGRWLQSVATLGTEEPLETIRVPIGPEGGGIAQAYLTLQVIFCDGQAPVPDDLRLKPPYDSVEAFRSRAFILLPLIVQGRAIGVMGADRKHSRRPLDPTMPELLQLFAAQAAVAIHNVRLLEQVQAGRQRLQTLSRKLVAVQEAERHHLARELHDEIGQMLTGVKLTLEMSMRSSPDAIRTTLGEAQGQLNDLMARVRMLSLDLRPAMLDDLGLVPALLWHFERYTAQTSVRVDFRQAGLEGRLRPELETAVYRIVQEALTNVARHAGVNEATVILRGGQDILGVQVQDQGRGFNPATALGAYTSSGLVGMSERAELLGGHLTVESAPGAGTRVTVKFPVTGRIDKRKKPR